MLKKKKIVSRLLLTIYLLVGLHCSYSHGHTYLFGESCAVSHAHEEFEAVHHEHDFHVGIFHFLGHLFEELRHVDTDDLGDDHLIISPKTPSQKIIVPNGDFNYYYNFDLSRVFPIGAESLPAPPAFSLTFSQRLIKSGTPLRGPPLFS